MSNYCRTCGKFIYCQQPQNLFEPPDNAMLQQIEALTGFLLKQEPDMPSLICGSCIVALRAAIDFRKCLIKTQNLLQTSINVSEALNEINRIDFTELDMDVNSVKDELLEPYAAGIKLCEESQIRETPHDAVQRKHSTLKNVEQKIKLFESSILKEQPKRNANKPAVQQKKRKSSPTVFTSLTFRDRVNKPPRLNWSTLTEEQIVEINRKRARRECICEQCGRYFTNDSSLRVHMLRHTGIKNFSCKTCSKKFYTAHLLRRHEDLHVNKRPHACPHCGDTFSDYKTRLVHIRTRHTNYLPFKCTECDRSFPMSCYLKYHMLSHTGVRNFHCETCDLSFLRKNHLNTHYRSKGHKQNIEKLDKQTTKTDNLLIASN